MAITIDIVWGNKGQTEYQKKSFKNLTAALEWCMKHYQNIQSINSLCTGFHKFKHYAVYGAILESC